MEKEILGSDLSRRGQRLILLREAPRIPWNQASPSNVTEFQHQHDDTLETNTSSTVGRGAPLEAIEVVGHRLRVNISFPHLLLQKDGIVDTLAAGKNLLTTNEDIIGIGQERVFWIGHGVEGTSTGGEFVC